MLDRLVSPASNSFYKLMIIIILCGIALIPLWAIVIKDYLSHLQLIRLERVGNQHQEKFKQLIHDFPQHQRLTSQVVNENSNQQFEIQHLNQTIDQHVNQILAISDFNPNHENSLSAMKNKTRQIGRHWQEVKQGVNTLPFHELRPLYIALNENTKEAFDILGDSHRLLTNIWGPYHLMHSSLVNLPRLQSYLYQISYYLADDLQRKEFSPLEAKKLYSDLQFIQYHVHELEQQIKQASVEIQLENHLFNPDLLANFQVYVLAIQQLTYTINDHFVGDSFSMTGNELISLGNVAISAGTKLWKQIGNELDLILKNKEVQLQRMFWPIFLISVLAALTALCLGLYFYDQTKKRAAHIQEAIQKFTKDQTFFELPVSADEMGFIAQAFNQMAAHLDQINVNFNKFLNGVKKLSKGDLGTRLELTGNDPVFDQTIRSFNHMAANFEGATQYLQQLGGTLMHSAGQIATASKEQETIIIEQEATTREIGMAANEISSTARQLALTMNEVSQGAEQTSHLASIGKKSLTSMESLMHQMMEASSVIATKLAILNERATNITTVITTITKVSDQTNLLSLNASIEAEKAGEYGKSFAVIAKEIRRLADQTALATLDIEKIVNEMLNAVSSSVMGVDDFSKEIRKGVDEVRTVSEQLATIIGQVQNFTTQIEIVNQGMQAQSTGAEQINEAINQLSFTSQQTADSIRGFYRTIQELNAAANELRILTPQLQSNLRQEV